MRLEEFSEAAFQKALQRTIRALTRGKTIPDQPKAILLGGQSGAGKTTIHRIKQKEFQGNIIIIDGDSYHLLIEGTLRTTQVPRQTAQLLASKGYQVSLAVIGTKPELSYLSTLIRYEELYAIDPNQARATPKEHHDGIVENLVDNLRELESEKIFDQIQIYQRDRTCIYDSKTYEGSAAEVLQNCLFGEWSKVEEEMLKVGRERLQELIEDNILQNNIK